MKKLFTNLLLMLVMGVSGAWADDVETFGTTNDDLWWTYFSKYYSFDAEGGVWDFDVTINSSTGANIWNDWCLVGTTDADRGGDGYAEHVVMRTDGYSWNSLDGVRKPLVTNVMSDDAFKTYLKSGATTYKVKAYYDGANIVVFSTTTYNGKKYTTMIMGSAQSGAARVFFCSQGANVTINSAKYTSGAAYANAARQVDAVYANILDHATGCVPATYTKFYNGEVAEADYGTVAATIASEAQEWANTNITSTEANADYTLRIKNPDFETGTTDGWTITGNDDASATGLNKTGGIENTYIINGMNHYYGGWPGKTVSQNITLPAGKYKLTAQVNSWGANCNLKVNDVASSTYSEVKTLTTMEQTFNVYEGGTVTIGNGASFGYRIDNFTLVRTGDADPQYTVTCNAANNGTVTADVTTVGFGSTVTLTVTPADGYELDALTVKDASNNDVTVTDNKFTMPASNVTVTATFKEKVVVDPNWKIDFSALGLTADVVATVSSAVSSNMGTVTVGTTALDTRFGLQAGTDYGWKFYKNGYVWNINTGARTLGVFSAKAGQFVVLNSEAAPESAVNATSTNDNGNQHVYKVTADGDVTFQMTKNKAIYSIIVTDNLYKVTYDANGGTGTVTDEYYYEPNAKVTVKDNTFSKSESNTNGWNTKADGTGTQYVNGGTFTITENTTLYAQWTNHTIYTEGTIGSTEKNSAWWTAFSPYTTINKGETYTFSFKNNAGSPNNWNTWSLCGANKEGHGTMDVNGYTEYFVLRADNYGWDDYYQAPSKCEYDWDNFLTDMQSGNYTTTMNVTFTGTQFVMTSATTDASNTRKYNYDFSSKEFTEAESAVLFFAVDNSYLTNYSATKVTSTKETTTQEVKTDPQYVAPSNETAATAVTNAINSTNMKAESNVSQHVEGVPSNAKSSYVNVSLKSATADGSDVTGMSFDVKPQYVASDGTVMTINNSAIKSAITFRLPVPSNNTKKFISIQHKADNGSEENPLGTFAVQGDDTNGFYIEVSVKSFSTFICTATDNQEAVSSANLQGYKTFYNATQTYQVDDNSTIYTVTAAPTAGATTVTINPLTTKIIPAGKAVIIKTTNTSDYKITLTKTSENYSGTEYNNNALKAATAAGTIDNAYILAYTTANDLGFYKYTGSFAVGDVYVTIPASGAKLNIVIGGETTAVKNVATENATVKAGKYLDNGKLVIRTANGTFTAAGARIK